MEAWRYVHCNDIDPKHFVLNCFAAERFLFVLPEQQFLLLFLSDLHCCQFSDFAAWNEVKLMDRALIKSWIRKYGGINGLYIIHYCPLVASLHLVISRRSTTTALWFILTLSLSLGTIINSPFMVAWAKLLEKRELLHVVCRNVTHTRCLASIWNKWTQEDTVHATFLFSVTTVVFVSETRTQHVQQ